MRNTLLKISLIFLFFCLTSCKQSPDEMINNLPGYWEIVDVTDPAGNKKEFKISTIIDFIELNGNKGLRTKVNPQLDGSFLNNGTTENFDMEENDNTLLLNYDNNLGIWSEEVLFASKDKLVVRNTEGKEYSYKRFEGFAFNKDASDKKGGPLQQ
jgi:hypothetical protein